jgi:hypothetical protein
MSDESSQKRSEAARVLAKAECDLLRYLVTKAGVHLPDGWIDGARVVPLDDGGMGSLRIIGPCGEVAPMGSITRVAELEYKDADGVDVLVSLNVGPSGMPAEIDIWKTNFQGLINFPTF